MERGPVGFVKSRSLPSQSHDLWTWPPRLPFNQVDAFFALEELEGREEGELINKGERVGRGQMGWNGEEERKAGDTFQWVYRECGDTSSSDAYGRSERQKTVGYKLCCYKLDGLP